MNRVEMEVQANRVIAAAKDAMESGTEFDPVFMVHHAHHWEPFKMPDGAQFLLNSGRGKDAIFGFFRRLVQEAHADAVLFAMDSWKGVATPEGVKYFDTPEWKRLNTFGFDKLIQRGWIKRCEAIVLTVQNAEEVLIVTQEYQRLGDVGDQILLTKCERQWLKQDEFTGRSKMFGDLQPANLS